MKVTAKIMSVMLIICMLISFCVFAEEDNKALSDIDPNTLVGKAVNELISLKIIDGYTDGTFKPDNTITRAEMAKLIVAFLRLDDIGLSSAQTGFSDVDETNHWSSPYVNVAVAKGIIVGYGDGTFRPDNPVKYCEAVKMVVCALGLGVTAQNRVQEGTPWYSGYITVAYEKGILNGAATNNPEDPASRGTVAILLYKALDVNVADVYTTKRGGTGVSTSSKTARETYQQSEKLTGIVTAVAQTSLYSASSGLGKRYIEVENSSGSKVYMVSSNVDTYALLGYKISANESTESVDEYSFLDSIEKDSKNKTYLISADNIYSADSKSISYWESDSSTKLLTLAFDSSVAIIYNGRFTKDFTDADFDIESGSIRAIDNNNDGVADVVFINEYEIVAIKNVGKDSSTGNCKIYSLYNEGDIIIPSSGKYIKVTTSLGTVLDDPQKLTASKFDIANLMRSKDGEVFDLTITRNKVSGSVTSMIGNSVIAIKDKDYNVTYNFINYTGSDKPNVKVSSYVNAYLDINGSIAALEVSSSASTTSVYVGYLLYAEKEKGIDGKATVKLVGMVGSTGERTYKLANKVTVDGRLMDDHEAILDYLENVSKDINQGKLDYKIKPTAYAQLIKYTLSNGRIDSIDTVLPNETVANDDLVLDLMFPSSEGRDANGRYTYTSGSKFQTTYGSTVMLINSSTKILLIPDDMSEINKFKIVSTSYFTTSTGRRVEGYNLNNVDVAAYVLVYGTAQEATFNENSDIAIVKSVAQVMGDDDYLDSLTGWNFKTGADIKDKYTDKRDLLFEKVEQGEIFRYLLNSESKIEEIDMVLDINGDKLVFLPNVNEGKALESTGDPLVARQLRDYRYDPSRTASASLCRLIYGTVLSKNGNTLKITNTLYSDECGIDEMYSDTFSCTNSTKVFVLDMSKDANNRLVDNMSLDEIMTLEDVGAENPDEASQVLLFYQSGAIKTVIVIK